MMEKNCCGDLYAYRELMHECSNGRMMYLGPYQVICKKNSTEVATGAINKALLMLCDNDHRILIRC